MGGDVIHRVRVVASHEWSHPLHDVRASPTTLALLGAQHLDWLLLGGCIPCIAAMEDRPGCIAHSTLVVPAWMIDHLGDHDHDGEGHTLSLYRTHSIEGDDETAVHLEKATPSGRRSTITSRGEEDKDEDKDDEEEEEEGEEYDGSGGRDALQGLDAAATRALRRQVAGMPIHEGWLIAFQRFSGVQVFRIVRTCGNENTGSAHSVFGTRTAIQMVLGGLDTANSDTHAATPGSGPGHAVRGALRVHVLTLLVAPNSGSDGPGVDGSLVAAAMRCGHALLCGPPGNGKHRFLAKLGASLRSSSGVRVVRLRCATLLAASETGRLDQAITSAFARAAERAPSVILISELSLLARASPSDATPSSDAFSTSYPTEHHVAMALLLAMRRLPSRVVVLASVTAARMLPAELRSHGGFEVIFELPAMSHEERSTLLAKWLPSASAAGDDATTSDDAMLDDETVLTDRHAAQLSRLAASHSLRDLRRVLAAASAISAARGGSYSARTTWGDLREALGTSLAIDAHDGSVPSLPSASVAGPSWANVGGYGALRARLERLLQLVAYGTGHSGTTHSGSLTGALQAPSGALLFGQSGNGKSHVAAGLAQASGWPTLHVKASSLYGTYVGDTEAAIRELFRRARERAPSLIVLDEIDALGGSRGRPGGSGDEGGGGSSVADRALSTFLNEMDGIGISGPTVTPTSATDDDARPAIFLIGCTNSPELVDAALLRPGRLEQLLYVGPPDAGDRAEVLQVHTAHLPLAQDVSLTLLAEQTCRFSCAALAALCREAARIALRRLMGSDAADIADAEASDDDEPTEGDGLVAPPREVSEIDVMVTMQDFLSAKAFIEHAQVLSEAAHSAQQQRYEDFRTGRV